MNIRRENDIAIVSGYDRKSTLREWGVLFDQLDRLDCPTVIDARSVGGDLTEIDAYLLALKADEMQQLRRHRMAIVANGDLPRDVAFFIASGKNLGLAIESFDSFETATTWVSHQGRSLLADADRTC